MMLYFFYHMSNWKLKIKLAVVYVYYVKDVPCNKWARMWNVCKRIL